jgi:hypothetical protein
MNEPVEAAVVRVLREADEPLTTRAVVSKVRGRATTVLRALQALEAEGAVQNTAEPALPEGNVGKRPRRAAWVLADPDRQFVGGYWRRTPRREAS